MTEAGQSGPKEKKMSDPIEERVKDVLCKAAKYGPWRLFYDDYGNTVLRNVNGHCPIGAVIAAERPWEFSAPDLQTWLENEEAMRIEFPDPYDSRYYSEVVDDVEGFYLKGGLPKPKALREAICNLVRETTLADGIIESTGQAFPQWDNGGLKG